MMNSGPTLLLAIAIAIVIIAMVRSAARGRGGAGRGGQQTCEQCRMEHPAQARFCRRCGRKLG